VSGGVRLARGGDSMNGTGLRLRVHDNIGRFDHAEYEFSRRGRSGFAPVRARGTAEVIKLEGKDKYRLENATFTTCKPGNNDWYLQVDELERRGAGTALVTMCAGGAMATATIIERI
jgi:LPS-assembly protein